MMTMPEPRLPSDLSARLVATEGRTLPLEASALRVDARAGLARVVFEQRFRNTHAEPLSVTYKLPLPADAAVSGFSFTVGGKKIVGVVEGRSAAREQYEQAILDGKSAALLEEDRSSLFTQEIGNIPPGASITAEIEIDQPLAWLASEGAWELRFPLAAAPRYLGAGPITGNVSLDVATGEIGARASLALTIRDTVPQGRSPESPSHAIVVSRAADTFAVELGGGGQAPLDRDLVVRWPAALAEPGATIDVARAPGALGDDRMHALLTLVPPLASAKVAPLPRDLTLLLDTSGSMSGEPLEQMKRIASAMVDSLAERDTVEIVEFSMQARAYGASPERATPALKKDALKWIRALKANGGTEMVTGVREAMRTLRAESQRQIVIITDGLVGFERDVVRSILDLLPPAARFHAVGVGPAVNRSLLAPVARAGRGAEAIVGLGEDPERAAARILSHTADPVVVDLVIEGSAVRAVSPARLPDLFGGAPARLALELAPEGGEVLVRGRTASGLFERRLLVAAVASGLGSAAVSKLFARERVEDLEMRIASGENVATLDAEIEALGKRHQIATRLTSWIAVSAEATVDPRAPSRKETQPQALPHGMSAEGLGLRAPSPMQAQAMAMPMDAAAISAGYMGGFPGMAPGMGGRQGMGGPPGMAPPPMMRGRMAPPTGAAPPPARAAMPRSLAAKSKAPMAPAPAPAQARDEKEDASAAGRPMRDEGAVTGKPRSFAEKAIEAVSGFLGYKGAPPPPAEEPKPAESYAEMELDEPSELHIEARVVRTRGTSVLIELGVPEPGLELRYEGATATIVLDDGTTVEARIDASASTHEASYAANVVVRISLELDAAPNRGIAEVRVTLASGRVVILARP